ncbi:right-handed parallel beta-helix repeat-containing protein [Natrinema salaciae]|uniref:Right handed beta helix region n=1 Tax=Natrinema salaciae TaxID=1186196 RepID=A0A1H9BV75_9EURY|nr:right-handed parallel beta-helix repeat-containing protein [Natrinema salaciae]SEP92865.1 hypothetical protein SAMN04489841_0867 [Natrinema salaciae]
MLVMDEDNQEDRSGSARGETSRRSYVRMLGALGIGGALSGVAATSSRNAGIAAAQSQEAASIAVSDSGTTVDDDVSHLDFGESISVTDTDADTVTVRGETNPNVVDVRDDLGVEPEADDLWGAIEDHYYSFEPTERNHCYKIPAGTWYVDTDNVHFGAHEFLGIVGEPFAVLEVTDQDVDRLMTVGTIDTSLPNAQRTVLRNVQVDISGEYDAGICRWYTYRYGLIENVSMRGQRNKREPTYGGDLHTIMVDGRLPTTTNVIRNCHLVNGDTYYDRDSHFGFAIPFASEIYNRGTNHWESCKAAGYISHGFYVSHDSGRNVLSDCHTHNCGAAHIRLGTNDSAQNCRISMTEHPGVPWTGLWLEDDGNQRIDGLNVTNEVRKNTELVRLTQDGPARLTNVSLTDTGTDGRAIRIDDSGDAQAVFDRCSLTDRTSPSVSDYAVSVRSSRVTFTDCEFDVSSQSSTDRHGLFVTDGDGSIDRIRIDGCSIDSDDASLRFAESGADHSVESSFFDGLVMSDPDTELSNVLWTGNRHYGETDFRGERVQWQGDFNFGYEL